MVDSKRKIIFIGTAISETEYGFGADGPKSRYSFDSGHFNAAYRQKKFDM